MSAKTRTESPPKSAAQIRRDFLDFFVARGHREVPSAPVFPQDDPTLLFTNAGMNQFKDVFLGTGRRDYSRAVDTQKCIRVSGKHNDLEEVGHDTYHHTFFEMLGNWSFGDYFKEDAIAWSWELLTKVWKLPKERLWATVFGGDEKDGLPRDEDSARIWKSTDIDPSHVLFFGRKDNFWEMGDTGPCGPCTEIHIDRGCPDTDPRDGADLERGVNAGNERFMELWNNVFIEFNRRDDGSLVKLPAQHVDTGMGFERIVGVLQGKRSNYDTDVFAPIFSALGKLAGKRYGSGDEKVDVAFRVIADHVRACTAAFADGALPSNVGRGYVLRRLIRRASRYGRQALGFEDPFLCDVAPAVAETLGEVFPEIPRRIEHVQLLLRAEEESFNKTLGRGLVRFGSLADACQADFAKALKITPPGSGLLPEVPIPGGLAFELYATDGFPKDLIELMARERGLAIDQDGWKKAEEAHRAKSKSESKFKSALSEEQLAELRECEPTRSTYWDEGERSYEVRTSIEHVLSFGTGEEGEGSDSSVVEVILRDSPFYPESGGQVADTGIIESLDGAFRVHVTELARRGEHIVHSGKVALPYPADSSKIRGQVVARVDRVAREKTRKNHTATHLLHKALKLVLGEHVAQQGSYVGPDRLRFDFSHPKAVTPEELAEIESKVNSQVMRNSKVTHTEMSMAEAKKKNAVAMFGEKYGETVRVLDVGGWSLELCGGTHVAAAGDIGPFVITSEGAIQAGVRRIEALTGEAAVAHIQHQKKLLQEAARALKAPVDELPARIEQLQKQLKDAKRKEKESSKGDVAGALEAVRAALAPIDGIQTGIAALELDLESLRELAGRVRALAPDLAVILLGAEGEKAPWIALAQGDAPKRGWDARKAAAHLKERLGGGGGGKPDLAQGQGLAPDKRAMVAEEFRKNPPVYFRDPPSR